jgi:hypothetical protein
MIKFLRVIQANVSYYAMSRPIIIDHRFEGYQISCCHHLVMKRIIGHLSACIAHAHGTTAHITYSHIPILFVMVGKYFGETSTRFAKCQPFAQRSSTSVPPREIKAAKGRVCVRENRGWISWNWRFIPLPLHNGARPDEFRVKFGVFNRTNPVLR